MQLRNSTFEPTGIMKKILDNFEKSYQRPFEEANYFPVEYGQTCYELKMIERHYRKKLNSAIILDKGWSADYVEGYQADLNRLEFCEKLFINLFHS